MRKHKASRYAQLTDEQRKELTSVRSPVIVHPGFDSYTGPAENLQYFQAALGKFRSCVAGLASADLFEMAFVRWCNGSNRNSKRNFETAQSQFANGFVAFLHATDRRSIPVAAMDTELINEFLNWLNGKTDTNPKNFAPETQRRYYGLFAQLLTLLKKHPNTSTALNSALVFPKTPFSGQRGGEAQRSRISESDKLLDDGTWKRLLDACRAEIAETITIYNAARAVWELEQIPPPEKHHRSPYRSLDVVWWKLNSLYPERNVPGLAELRTVNRSMANQIQHTHRYGPTVRPFQPEPDTILPFALLSAAYTFANYGPLLSLTHRQTIEKIVMDVARYTFDFIKPRGTDYLRSFAVDDDMFSPSSLFKFLKQWTSRIRPLAGKYVDRCFIFVTNEGEVRGYSVAKDDGTDSDQTWKHALTSFLRRHQLPRITIQVIRDTGLDIVRFQNNDDIRAVQAAGGQVSKSTVERHYDGPGTKRKRTEHLAEGMTVYARWANTQGKVDHRRSGPNADIAAATPGWKCFDPFDSPIPGEVPGRICQAFGRCPACPMGFLDFKSPYALARCLQLQEETISARTYLEAQRWKDAFEPVLKVLRTRWLPAFTDKSVRDAASRLNLNPIGRLE